MRRPQFVLSENSAHRDVHRLAAVQCFALRGLRSAMLSEEDGSRDDRVGSAEVGESGEGRQRATEGRTLGRSVHRYRCRPR